MVSVETIIPLRLIKDHPFVPESLDAEAIPSCTLFMEERQQITLCLDPLNRLHTLIYIV